MADADFLGLAAEVLSRGGVLRFEAGGRSMAPFIRGGDRLTVVAAGPCDLVRGDVVLYRTPFGRAVAHRVLRIGVGPGGTRVLWARGDGDAGRCDRVAPADVLGRVVAHGRPGHPECPLGRTARLAGLVWAAGQSARGLLRRIAGRVFAAPSSPQDGRRA